MKKFTTLALLGIMSTAVHGEGIMNNIKSMNDAFVNTLQTYCPGDMKSISKTTARGDWHLNHFSNWGTKMQSAPIVTEGASATDSLMTGFMNVEKPTKEIVNPITTLHGAYRSHENFLKTALFGIRCLIYYRVF